MPFPGDGPQGLASFHKGCLARFSQLVMILLYWISLKVNWLPLPLDSRVLLMCVTVGMPFKILNTGIILNL